jgi:hypothetical protein
MYPFADDKTGDTLWELGLYFTVSPGKTGFRGAQEHYRLKGKERFKIYDLMIEGTEQIADGAPLFKDGVQVGTATVGLYSELNGYNVAIARMPVEGVVMTVKSGGKDMACKAHSLPFYDPDKKKRSAKGRSDQDAGPRPRVRHQLIRDKICQSLPFRPASKAAPAMAVWPHARAIRICSSPMPKGPRRSLALPHRI